MNFWDFSSWGFFNLMAVLLASLLVAQMLKRSIPALEASLIPTSVLGGGVLLLISTLYKAFTGQECSILHSSAATALHGWSC